MPSYWYHIDIMCYVMWCDAMWCDNRPGGKYGPAVIPNTNTTTNDNDTASSTAASRVLADQATVSYHHNHTTYKYILTMWLWLLRIWRLLQLFLLLYGLNYCKLLSNTMPFITSSFFQL